MSVRSMIEVYDDAFDKEWCQLMIDQFETWKSKDMTTVTRREINLVQDERVQYDWAPHPTIVYWHPDLVDQWYEGVNACYMKYRKEYQILEACGPHSAKGMSIQKTTANQGYHNWHSENMEYASGHRLLVYALYLNDVDEGGETEFLYQGEKVAPKAGRMVMWPASFTHPHRGNPIYKGEKYIITGWITFDNVGLMV